ncbi:hypothetical protein BGZ72_009891 [Mortierella alpina]|nr:hypothetical protein BGZ72_009891 [Mortierella alpina]
MAAASTLTSSHSSTKLASGVSAAAVEGYERREADQCVWYTIRVYPCPIIVRGDASMPIPCKSYSVYRRYEDVVEFAERLEAERPFFKTKHDATYIVRRLVPQSIKGKANAAPPPWSPVNAFGTEADCMRRKRNLDIYLQELFKLGPAIGQCRLAVEFFGMWKTDVEAHPLPALHPLVTKPCEMSKRNKQLCHSLTQREILLGLSTPFKNTSDSSLSLSSCDSTGQLASRTSPSGATLSTVPSVSGARFARTPTLANNMIAQSTACLPSPPGSSYHSDDEELDDEEGDDEEDMDNSERHKYDEYECSSDAERMDSPSSSIDDKNDSLNCISTEGMSLQPLWQTCEPDKTSLQIEKRHCPAPCEQSGDTSGPTTFPLTPLPANALCAIRSCDVEKSPCLVSKIPQESTKSLCSPIHAPVVSKIASFQSRRPTPVAAFLSEPGQALRTGKTSAETVHLSHVCSRQAPFAPTLGHPSSLVERFKSQDKRPLTKSIKRRKRVSGPRPSLSPTRPKPPPGILKNWTRTIKETQLTCQMSPLPPRVRSREHESPSSQSRMTSPTPGAQFLSKYPKAFVAVFKIVVDPERIVALQVMEKDEDFVLSVPDLRLRVSQKFERVEMPLPNEFELLASIALFGVAIYSFATDSQILLESHMLSWTMAILSGIVFLISILGCACAVSEIKRVIGTYGVLLSVLIVLQLFMLIYALTRHDQVDSILDTAWQNAYNNQPQTLQDLETRLHCCGYETVTDRAIPKTSNYACRDSPAFGYQTACKAQLKDAYSRHESAFLGVIAGIEVLQILALVCTMALFSELPSYEEIGTRYRSEHSQRVFRGLRDENPGHQRFSEVGSPSGEERGGYGAVDSQRR